MCSKEDHQFQIDMSLISMFSRFVVRLYKLLKYMKHKKSIFEGLKLTTRLKLILQNIIIFSFNHYTK